MMQLTLLILAVCLVLPGVTGCGGCRKQPDDAAVAEGNGKPKKARSDPAKRPKKKPDFEVKRVTLQPGDGASFLRAVKPGHWLSATQQMKTNNFDFVGQVEAAVVDNQGRPIGLSGTPFRLTTTRPAALPKGQSKDLEMVFFVPHTSRMTSVSSVLRGRRGGREILPSSEFFNTMPPYQYLLVVLAREPDRYAYIKVLDSVRAPHVDDLNFQPITYYLVVAPRISRRAPLPSHSLTWTSIAYLFWDDVDGNILSDQQQSALLDWLHWGGRLIISGPDSIDTLRSGFLAPYLPITGASACTLSQDDLRELNEHWTLPQKGAAGPPLTATAKWSGVTLHLHPEATAVPGTGRLLAQRAVGRGRVVVSAFRLDQRELVDWQSFDGFFNACLLGRPPRRYERTGAGVDLRLSWADGSRRQFDPRLVSGLRYFSRDTYLQGSAAQQGQRWAGQGRRREVAEAMPRRSAEALLPGDRGGAASWNSQNDAAGAARRLLREAAGIAIPRAGFVVRVLIVYLLVLVPINYLVFRALGRLEWAWVAAPVIAVVCALVVVQRARLDIGFARSETQIGVLEAHGGYPRGHLTRYTALYTSLSTSYDLKFDDRSALAQPFPADSDFKLVSGQARSTVTYARYQDVCLKGLKTNSNTTAMVHSEQMYDMGGPLSLDIAGAGPPRVTNGTRLDLADVVVVRKRVAGSGVTRWALAAVGDLTAGTTVPLDFRPAAAAETWIAAADRPPSSGRASRLQLHELIRLALDADLIEPGEIRLVGRIDEVLSGLEIDPAASQVRSATLVVAHLLPGPGPPLQPDVNTRADVEDVARTAGPQAGAADAATDR